MKNVLIAGAFAVMGFWLMPPAAAHHSMTGFDKKNTVKLEGVVKNFNWQNPHCYIEIEVPGKDGKPDVWNVEMTAPGYLIRAGWKKTTVKAGDRVTILANPLLTGEHGALFVSVTLPDGQTFSQRGVEPAGKQK